ncbi:amidohydrolase [Bacillus sp. FJAT-27225]|uniref:amidohydrolase n=1 Tax=Bacillus sp. FJAT-27225 TaxID=1743144 RepID=UPI00080C2C39|nr:amidohydrolase [Bacillus sp. FJAT-27225]OCA91392.1 amidohydrolase [Bacillus sp. FJAT-27225]
MATLLYGGPIYTLIEEGHQVEAVLTKEGRIVETGTVAQLEAAFSNEIDKRIDLQGCTMIPGIVDSHIHLIGHGERLIRLDLSLCKTRQEVLEAVKAYSLGLKEGDWLVGEGWNENLWEEPRPLHKAELDEIAPNHPVLLKRICRHAVVANSLALKAAGIDENSVVPAGGVISADESGSITGVLKDSAQDLLYSVIPPASEDYLLRAMKASIHDLYKLGITGVHTEDLNYYGGFEKTFRVFKRVIEQDGLRFRAHLLVHHGVIDDFAESGHSFQSGNEWIEFGAMKIFSDGALGGRTALLSEPYADEPSTSGVAIFSREELSELVGKARKYNMPVAIHAIGDLAFEYCLDAIEANPLNGPGRDRLIHAQILREDLIERAARLPVVLDLQPAFLQSDFPWVIDRIGSERLEHAYAWKTLLDKGIACSGGSDAPIEYPNPYQAIDAAVNRMAGGKVYGQNQALSVYEAVSLFTKGSAYAASHEQNRGEIKKGNLADFTILDRNLFSIPKETLGETEAVMTIIGGEVVFEKNNDRKITLLDFC